MYINATLQNNMDAQTQTECPTLTRDAEIARLIAQNDRLRRFLKYADRESQRARAAAATADELTECRMRIIQLTGYNAKLVRITELLSERVGLTTKRALPRATPLRTRAAQSTPTPPSDVAVPAPTLA